MDLYFASDEKINFMHSMKYLHSIFEVESFHIQHRVQINQKDSMSAMSARNVINSYCNELKVN